MSWECFCNQLDVGWILAATLGSSPQVTAWCNDGLALFFQQGDEPLFGADVAGDELVGVVEVADDGGLLVVEVGSDDCEVLPKLVGVYQAH